MDGDEAGVEELLKLKLIVVGNQGTGKSCILNRFINGSFDVNEAVNRADDLKYRNLIKKTMIKEFENPSDEFVRVIGKQIYDGVLTQSLRERFARIIVSVNTEFINERVQKRLADAVQSNEVETAKDEAKEEESLSEDGIITTDIEKEGYFIIRSIASEHNHESSITIRDQKKYCNILFEDNKYYPIVRFYFNNEKRLKIELFDEIRRTSNGGKIGDKHNIEQVSDLYNFKDRILALVDKYVEEKSK